MVKDNDGEIALMMEVANASEMMLNFYETALLSIPENSHFRLSGRLHYYTASHLRDCSRHILLDG
jgi:hypothetical protein